MPTFLSSVNWGAVLSVVSFLPFLAAVVVETSRQIRAMPPQDRNDWLHRALAVALAIETEASNPVLPNVAGNVNAYLKLHNVPIRVTPDQTKLLLAEFKSAVEAQDQPPPPAKSNI